MSQITNCPTCGGALAPDVKFCKFCGTSIDQIDASTPEPASEPEAPKERACPQCGAPIQRGDYKFCGSCGAVLENVSSVVAAGGIGAPPTFVQRGVPAAPGPMPTMRSQQMMQGASAASAKFDSFMGASVDLDSVGKDFSPEMIQLGGFDDADLARAFAFFGATLNAQPLGSDSKASADQLQLDGDEARRIAEKRSVKEESVANSKERRDFSAQEGTTVFGSLSSQLLVEFAPTVDMIADQRGAASKKEHKDRLKHKVALGDMDKREAIKQSEE